MYADSVHETTAKANAPIRHLCTRTHRQAWSGAYDTYTHAQCSGPEVRGGAGVAVEAVAAGFIVREAGDERCAPRAGLACSVRV